MVCLVSIRSSSPDDTHGTGPLRGNIVLENWDRNIEQGKLNLKDSIKRIHKNWPRAFKVSSSSIFGPSFSGGEGGGGQSMKTDMGTLFLLHFFDVLHVDNHLAKFQIKSIATSISGE